MKTMSLIGLISAGIIIGVAGNSYFSTNESSRQQSLEAPDKNTYVTEEKQPYNKVRQSNPFDTSFTPAATELEYEENISNAGISTTPASAEAVSNMDNSISTERPENIILPNTHANMLSVTGNVGALTWEPSSNTDYENLNIQLSGPDSFSISKDFYSGEVASITESLPDGYYNWQTVTTPTIDPYIKQQMAAVRAAGDSIEEEQLKQRFRNEGSILTREQAKNNVQSGGFRIFNGDVLDSDISE